MAAPLVCALIPSGLTQPVLKGAVATPGLGISFSPGNVDDNSRGMIAGKFDIAEMSIGTYVQAKSRGADLIALPIILGRRFLQPCVLYGTRTRLGTPADLRGKKIAFPQFWMTSSVWHRGLLEHEYGVPATAVEFLTTQDERVEAPFTAGVKVTQIANRPLMDFFKMIPQLLDDGTADVVFAPRLFDELAGLARLFRDPTGVTLEYRRRTGIYPLMHTIVLRGALVRERPELGPGLAELFTRSKAAAYADPAAELESPLPGTTFEQARALLGGDPYPFGIDANRASLEAFFDYAFEQQLSATRVAMRDSFYEAA
jgi:4,5-dihydroxyphthalate decarboxylase